MEQTKETLKLITQKFSELCHYPLFPIADNQITVSNVLYIYSNIITWH